MKAVEQQNMEERAFRKAKIEEGCELYLKMAERTGRLPNNCWTKIMEDIGSPQWMKRYHLYNEIKRKRQQQPKSKAPIQMEPVTMSIVTNANDDVSEASTLDELIKQIITTDKDDASVVSQLTECGPEDREMFYPSKEKSYAKTDLTKIKKRLYSSPSKAKQVKRVKRSD